LDHKGGTGRTGPGACLYLIFRSHAATRILQKHGEVAIATSRRNVKRRISVALEWGGRLAKLFFRKAKLERGRSVREKGDSFTRRPLCHSRGQWPLQTRPAQAGDPWSLRIPRAPLPAVASSLPEERQCPLNACKCEGLRTWARELRPIHKEGGGGITFFRASSSACSSQRLSTASTCPNLAARCNGESPPCPGHRQTRVERAPRACPRPWQAGEMHAVPRSIPVAFTSTCPLCIKRRHILARPSCAAQCSGVSPHYKS
jgi:hypothetical protein